jgi:hypothetical protein
VRRFRYEYGAGPLHLSVALLALTVAGYVTLRVAQGAVGAPVAFAVWFLAAIVAHDFVLVPLYSLLDRLGRRAAGVRRARPEDERRLVLARRDGRWVVEPAARSVPPPRVSWLNHVRFPALASGLLLLLFFPLVLGLSEEDYALASGQSTDGYLERWALLSAGLFAVSGAVYAVRRLRSGAGRGPL